jgi:hypothetical protein
VTPAAFIEVHLVTRRENHSPAVNRLLRVAEQTSRQQGWLEGALEEPVAGVRNRRALGLDGVDIGAIDGAYEV